MDRFDELKQRYAQALPDKADQIDTAWQRFVADPANVDARRELHQIVHRLSGSAAAYGFEELGDLAQAVDSVFSDWLAQSEFERAPPAALHRTLRAGVVELLAALRTHDVVS
jgi:chemotaxis protein histidine kinase CheA